MPHSLPILEVSTRYFTIFELECALILCDSNNQAHMDGWAFYVFLLSITPILFFWTNNEQITRQLFNILIHNYTVWHNIILTPAAGAVRKTVSCWGEDLAWDTSHLQPETRGGSLANGKECCCYFSASFLTPNLLLRWGFSRVRRTAWLGRCVGSSVDPSSRPASVFSGETIEIIVHKLKLIFYFSALLSAEPRVRRILSERKKSLQKAIEGLGQHGE